MTTVDGYFSQRPMPTEMVYLPDHEPTKVDPEIDPQEVERLSRQRHYGYSESEDARSIDERSIDESLPDYESRRGSGTFVQEIDSNGHIHYVQRRAQYVPTPQLPACACGDLQCITCALNGRAVEEHRRRKKERGCGKRMRRIVKLLLAGSITFIMVYVALFSHIGFRRSRHHGHHAHPDAPGLDAQAGWCPADIPYAIPTFDLAFNDSSAFSFKQYVTDDYGRNPQRKTHLNIEGKVEIRSATADENVEAGHIRVIVDVLVSNKEVQDDLEVYAEEHGVVIKSNRTLSTIPDERAPWDRACALIKATIIVPQSDLELSLEHFNVLVETMSIALKGDLGLTVNTKAVFRSVSGEILSMHRSCHDDLKDACALYDIKCEEESNTTCANFKARDLDVSTISGEIIGDWAIAESSSFDTKSSPIDIGLYSTTNLKDLSNEISLSVSSISGQVHVHPDHTDRSSAPYSKSTKKYSSKISSISGDITGIYILGNSLSLSTISGHIESDILPLTPGDKHPKAEFKTDTKSGSVRTRFLTHRWRGDPPPLTGTMGLGQSTLDFLKHSTRRLVSFFFEHENGPRHHHHHHGHYHEKHRGNSTRPHILSMPLSMASEDSTPIVIGTHNTISGNQWIHYPEFFEGTILAKSLTGKVDVEGKDVQITHESSGYPVGKVIEAIKGDVKVGGNIWVHAVSGMIDVCIGK